MQKVNSGKKTEMCWLEFDYAWRQEKTMHAVVLDKDMTNPRNWTGILSGNYFFNLRRKFSSVNFILTSYVSPVDEFSADFF